MKRFIKLAVVVVMVFGLSSSVFGGLYEIRKERRLIDNMLLTKYEKIIKDANTMADSKVILYFDVRGRIRKSYHLNVGADGAGRMITYYNKRGKVIYIVFKEGVSDIYMFQGAMYFKNGRPNKAGSRLFDNWLSAKKIMKHNVKLKKFGSKSGHGYYVYYYANTNSLKKDAKYPQGFKKLGKVHFGFAMNKNSVTLAHGVTLRSSPSLRGQKLAVLPAYHYVTPKTTSAPLYISGWGKYPWVKVVTYLKGKKLTGWFFGGMLNEEELK